MHAALAVGRRLCLGEARQASVVDATEFAVDVGGLHIQVRERRDDAWIFVSPVESGPGQELHAAIVDPRCYAKPVQFYFVHPLRPRGRLLDRLGKLRRDEMRKWDVAA
jgi:hypothetical protein